MPLLPPTAGSSFLPHSRTAEHPSWKGNGPQTSEGKEALRCLTVLAAPSEGSSKCTAWQRSKISDPPWRRLHPIQCHYRQVGNSGNCRSTHSPGIEVQRHVPNGSRRVKWDPGEGGVCLLGVLACWGCGWRKQSSLWILNRICSIQGSPAHPTMAQSCSLGMGPELPS